MNNQTTNETTTTIESLAKEAARKENSSREELVRQYTVDDMEKEYQIGFDDGYFEAQNEALGEIEEARQTAYDEGFLAAKRRFAQDPEFRSYVEAGH